MPKRLRRGSSLLYEISKDRCAELKRLKKIKAIEYLGGICQRCKVAYPPCVFDFHHIDPAYKEARGSTFLSWSWDRLVTELDKCMLLCSNCHRLEHYHK